MKIDLHIHTEFSDGDSVRRIIHYAKMKGLDAIAITDHNTFRGYFKAREDSKGLIIIPGIELCTNIGHVILLGSLSGIKEIRKINLDYLTIWDIANDNNLIMIIPHPVTLLTTKKGRFFIEGVISGKIPKPHAIEVYNSNYVPFSLLSKISRKIAQCIEVPEVAGSDAHKARNVGLCYTKIAGNYTSIDEIINALMKNEIEIYGRPAPLSERLKTLIHFLAFTLIKTFQ